MSNHNNKKNLSLLRVFAIIFPKVASISPKIFTINYIMFALYGVLDVVSIFCMQLLFDKVADLTQKRGTLQSAILALLVLFLVKLFVELASGIANFIGETYDMRTLGKLTHMINMKMSKLDPICFENPELLDDINKAYFGIRYASALVNIMMDILTFYSPYFLVMGIYLFKLKPILMISLLLVFLPVLLNQIIRSKVFSKLEDASAPLRRQNKYYESCVTSREYAKETRILGATPYFMRLFKETLTQINKLKWKADVKTNLIELCMKLISLAGYVGILWLLFIALINKEISVGAFAAVFASVDSMFNIMEEIISGRLPYCSENLGKVQNFLKFLDLPERKTENQLSGEFSHGDITLENVSFAYPLSNKNAVENINLKISKGETIALVGENGSGKSTLIRLITGLYLPTMGEVKHNNISTKEIDPKILFNGISGVLQKFQRYQLSLRENVVISEMDNKSKSDEDVNRAIDEARIHIDKSVFPKGVETMLSREFDGVDLSGGQWQKVAIARGLYREHELIVLDEPTAAIDPIEETKIYNQFTELSKDNTAVIVTHRLGSVKFADRIVVMKEGKIVGIGSHENLLSSCPYYEEMWNSQAQYYTETI